MAHPAKLTTPAEAALGFWVQVSLTPDGEPVSDRVTWAVLAVRLPPASTIRSAGWVAKAIVCKVVSGTEVNTSRAAGPTVIWNGLLRTWGREAADATSW